MPSVVPFVLGPKLAPDDTDQSWVERTQLLQRLTELAHHKLCLVLAPAGSGKTVLLSQYYHDHAQENAVAWLRLDTFDADAIRFFRHLSEAVRKIFPEFHGFSALQHVGNEQFQARLAMTTFVSGLRSVPRPLHILIDNIEYLEEAAWHPLLQQLVELSPPSIKWIFAGRKAVGVDTARWQILNQLGILYQPQLFFSEKELQQAFSANPIPLTSAQLQQWHQYTRGWPAGIKLAQIYSTQIHDSAELDPHRFGKQIFEELCTAVLAELEPGLKQFLIDTAFLEQCSAPLCDHALNSSISNQHIAALDQLGFLLEKNNDGDGFRYHPLLREYLDHCFQQQPVEKCDRLIARACTWLVEHDEREHACRLARRHSERGFFVEMLRQSFREWFREGDAEPVFRWANKLGESTLLAMRETRFAWCWALTMFGQLVAAESAISRTFLDSGDSAGHWRNLFVNANENQEFAAALIYSIIALFRGNLTEEHIDHLHRLHNAVAISRDLRASIDNVFAKYAIHRCQFFEARQRASQAALTLQQTGNRFGHALAIYLIADSYFQNNDLPGALQTCNHYLKEVPARKGNGARTLIEGFQAFLYYQADQPVLAEQRANDVLSHSQPGYSMDL